MRSVVSTSSAVTLTILTLVWVAVADPSSPIYDRGLAYTAGRPAGARPPRPRQVDTAAVPLKGPTGATGKWNSSSLVVSHRRIGALSECHRAPRSQSLHFRCGREIGRRRRAAWQTAPTSRSTSVRTSQRPSAGDWSFGIHGRPDKTVCLMTYWHVDRHFSSCGARRVSTAAGAISPADRVECPSRGPLDRRRSAAGAAANTAPSRQRWCSPNPVARSCNQQDLAWRWATASAAELEGPVTVIVFSGDVAISGCACSELVRHSGGVPNKSASGNAHQNPHFVHTDHRYNTSVAAT